MGRSTRAVVAALGLILGLLVGCSDQQDGEPAPSPPSPSAEPAPGPGTLLSSEPTQVHPVLASLGASAQKIRYASTSGVDGRPIEVSGLVVTPRGAPPPGGWPVIAYAHGTTGLADECAPSAYPDMLGSVYIVAPLVAAGYLVAATDYEGLGTDGPHPYLQPRSEANSVIDSVPAARELVPDAADRWIALGVSQGGQAVWATAEAAQDEGFLGSVALAPPTDLASLADRIPDGLDASGVALYPAVLNSVRQLHPEFDPADLVSGPVLDAVTRYDESCQRTGLDDATPADLTPRNPQVLEQVRGWLGEWSLPKVRAHGPMFVAAGGRDTLVPPSMVDAGVAAACELGTEVEYKLYPAAGHPALPAAAVDALRWAEDRFAGKPAPDTC